tara:strand:+ start:945 stop:1811 length:867 start_codon:yes stop_codon:yes gene_type:complete
MSINLVDFDNLAFNHKDMLGEGFFGAVYRVTDGKNYDDRFVAKVFHSPKLLSVLDKLSYGVSFNKEIDALKYLGPLNISPNVFHVHDSYSVRYYIMESMDTTLLKILEEDYFTREHLEKLNALLDRLVKSKYRHSDLHTNNIMWSDRLNDFRIIDWGMYEILNHTTDKINKSVSRMMLSGDMFVIIQLYIAYRFQNGDSKEYWDESFTDFLKYVPRKEHIFEKYSENIINMKVKEGIEDYILEKKNNNIKRSKIKTSLQSNPNKLTKREAEKLLSEATNTGFYELTSK